jgi:hypothetical protein
MPDAPITVQLDDALFRRLDAAATAADTTVAALGELFIRESLDAIDHPGIVFKPGPAGRRAALAGGPDVWEIASALRNTSGSRSRRIDLLAEEFGIHPRQIAIALNYHDAHAEEIDAWVAANDRALDELERRAAQGPHA